jgi:hypothetical protein
MKLAFEGELGVEPVTLEELFQDLDFDQDSDDDFDEGDSSGRCLDYNFMGNSVILPGVSSLAAGLFPFHFPIRLNRIDFIQGEAFHDLESVRCIRDLVFLLRHLMAAGPSWKYIDQAVPVSY